MRNNNELTPWFGGQSDSFLHWGMKHSGSNDMSGLISVHKPLTRAAMAVPATWGGQPAGGGQLTPAESGKGPRLMQ